MAARWLQTPLTALTLLLYTFLAGASVLNPPVLPLVVRNPYLSVWLQHARDLPWDSWPIFWTGQQIGMSLMAAVPASKAVYPLLGRPQDSLNYNSHDERYSCPEAPLEATEHPLTRALAHRYHLSFPYYVGTQFDASTTNLTYRIPAPQSSDDDAFLTVSFSSPITPTSSLRQSIPASYVHITVTGSFDVSVYMDVNGDWVSGDSNNVIQWYWQELDFDDDVSLFSWQIQKDREERFVEFNDRAEWGKLHFSAPADVSYQCGSSEEVRKTFALHGSVNDHIEQNFRSINDDEPVFAFSKTFQLSQSDVTNSSSVLFTLAHIQDEVVQYASARGLTYMRPLWKSQFFSDYSLIAIHYFDFLTASSLARNYSSQLAHDSVRAGGKEYADITALSARQVLGATSFSGTLEDPLIFLKEISSNGNTQTVDVIFPAWPFFTYTNPRWLAYLLEPLLEHQMSGQYPNKYSMHDLGAHFPNLTGHADGRDEYMPVEECGDMLIMALSLINSLQYGDAASADSLWSALGHDAAVPSGDLYPMPIMSEPQASGQSLVMDDRWGGGAKGVDVARSWLKRSYRILKQWTQYLVDESLVPSNQLCTDDFAGWLPFQTNLALKGIIGINAMSEISSLLGESYDAKYYKNISTTYIKKWREYGTSRDGRRAKLAYNWYGSWTTLYSLFSDAMLCFHKEGAGKTTRQPIHSDAHQVPLGGISRLADRNSSNFIDHDIYRLQSKHYEDVMQKYGLPLDSRHLYTKSDWQLQAAAVASPHMRGKIIGAISKWLNETVTDLPFTDLFDTEGEGQFGAGNRFTARPVAGSHFSLLSLGRACGGNAWKDFNNVEAW